VLTAAGHGPFDFGFDAGTSTDPDGTVAHYAWRITRN